MWNQAGAATERRLNFDFHTGDCPLLAQETVDGVAATLYGDKARYEAYLDPGAYKARGYACRGRSMFPMATPLGSTHHKANRNHP